MDIDRNFICNVISDMLDNPLEHGIYPTSTAFSRLEHYVEEVRMRALGWAHSYCCIALDKGEDPRCIEVPKIINQGRIDLGGRENEKR